MKKFLIILLAIVLIAALIFVIVYRDSIFPGQSPTPSEGEGEGEVSPSANGLVINEVVSLNGYCFTTEGGTTPDFIELYNESGHAISLNGYGLSDDEKNPFRYTFPNITIKAGEYILVLCEDDNGEEDGYLRSGFGLSATNGETISITAPDETVIQTLEVPALAEDISYGKAQDGTYLFFATPTPGLENSGTTGDSPVFDAIVSESNIVINEYIAQNQNSIMDEDGERYAWVELKNIGEEEQNLLGYGLSDSADNKMKWKLPERTLAPGEKLVIILSGKDRTEGSELHASFRLGKQDEQLLLSDAKGSMVDVVLVDHTMGNASYGRSSEDSSVWLYFPSPTPGKENTTKSFETLERATEKYLPDLSVNE